MSRSFDTTQTGANRESLLAPPSSVYNNLSTFTYAFWTYTKSISPTNSQFFFSKGDANNGIGQEIFARGATNTLQALVSRTTGAAFSRSVVALPFNQWVHIAMTYNGIGSQVRIFINGLEVVYFQQVVGSGALSNNSAFGLNIGSAPLVPSTDGYIAEFAVWNTPLSPAEIASIAASTTGYLGVAATDPVGYWHMCGTASPEPDVSGNGNHAVLSSNPPTLGPDSPGFNCNPAVTVNRLHNIDAILDRGALPGMIVQPNNFQPSLPRALIFQQIVTKPVRFLSTVTKTLSGG